MKYTVKIFTEIKADDYEDNFQVSYPCGYSCEKGIHRLKYTDEEAGFTVVKILPDNRIEVRRRKSFTIILQNGMTYRIESETPYGSIPMTFSLQKCSNTLSEDGGMLTYIADVEIGGQPQVNQVTMLLIPDERNDIDND
ncbi:MAG: DUF1934 domain-containing protein [Clostridia bacterium]|nr:DUF1934 domain-containing protein [Clostridia bacterium]